MEAAIPDTESASGTATWPPTAIPGQPGAHLQDPQPVGAEAPEIPVAEVRPAKEDAPLVGPLTEGGQVLCDLRAEISRYVVLPSDEALTAVTLWVAATHLQTAWQHAPRLAVLGPARRCGKSRLLDVITEVVHNPLITVNASAAAIFRSITDVPPTLLVDEVDTIFGSVKVAEKNEEMRGLLNAGHQRNRPTLRVSGPNHEVVQFPTFAMAALAGIGNLPDTVMDRSIVLRMRRRGGDESVEEFRVPRDVAKLHDLRHRLKAWLLPRHTEATDLVPPMPVRDRAADTWQPLIAVADLAGGQWPALARTACALMVAAETEAEEEHPGGARILADIRRVFAAQREADSLTTEELLHHLCQDPEGPWAEWGRGGLKPRDLGAMLREFGIRSGNVRLADGTQRKGYMRHKFLDPWRRYCPTVHPVGPTGPPSES
ncbi:DUF3631 domain-containing protein [Streptomyces goshikiensis]|uniref:DUF3631 domain-containing protein n=1 Tax=Streptomyces goshikiensis TaxID=1942 RepID=UPI0036B2EE2B